MREPEIQFFESKPAKKPEMEREEPVEGSELGVLPAKAVNFRSADETCGKCEYFDGPGQCRAGIDAGELITENAGCGLFESAGMAEASEDPNEAMEIE